MESVLSISDLVVRFRSPDGLPLTALDLPELTVQPGEVITVAGSSGSGKTTLLNVIAGLVELSAGSVVVQGRSIGAMSETQRDRFRARTIGYVHQSFNLLPGYTALENVLLAMTFAGDRPRREQQGRAAELLDRVGMGHRLSHRPGQLSGGELQRVGIARALANDPPIILADEPTANLDERNARQVLELLYETVRERRVTLILATHDPTLIERADRLVRLGQVWEEARHAAG